MREFPVGQRRARLTERQSAARFPVTFHNPFKVANPALSYPSSIPLQQTAPDSPRQYDQGIGTIPFQKQTIEIGEPRL